MNERATSPSRLPSHELVSVIVRWILAGVFVYMGLSKALHPVDFLKLLRQYEVIESHILLDFIAAVLPWFEVLCGLLLLSGIAVRGTACLALVMLVAFTLAVLNRALAIHSAKAIPFCAIRFDCGCGAGEVIICQKLLENALLILLSAVLFTSRVNLWCLRYELVRSRQSEANESEPSASKPAIKMNDKTKRGWAAP